MNTESQSFSCPNPSCGKVFSTPIRAENVGMKGARPYDACPYCLTEIIVEPVATVTEETSRPEPERADAASEDRPIFAPKFDQGSARAYKCPYNLGYLSHRSSKEKIPEDCMMCENIVKCMLKGVTG